jgi:hypothetical protein
MRRVKESDARLWDARHFVYTFFAEQARPPTAQDPARALKIEIAHARHNPPFQDRARLLSAKGRANYVGVHVECGLCAGARRPSTSRQKRQEPNGS